jgi:WD40 repeat protein
MQFSADGSQCAVMTATGVKLHRVERPSGHREFGEDLGTHLKHAEFSPDGRWLAASAQDELGLWDLTVESPGAMLEKARASVPRFSPDARELYASRNNSPDTDAFRWSIAPGTNAAAPPDLAGLPLHKPVGLTFLSVHSSGVAITGAKGSCSLGWEQVETGTDDWRPTIAGINGVSPDGRWLAIYQPYGTSLHVYRLPGMEPVATLQQLGSIADFQFSANRDEVGVASRAGVALWDTRSWTHTRTLTNFSRIYYPPDDRTFWLRNDLRAAGLYHRGTMAPLLLLPTGMVPLAVSPDGNHVAVSVEGRRLQVWDMIELRRQFRELGLDWEDAEAR